MRDASRTIVARLTPAGTSALATLSILGPDAIGIAESLFRSRSRGSLASARTDRSYYGDFGSSTRDDVVLRIIAREPIPSVEIHCHGGSAMVEALIAAIVERGAQRVDWREFLAEQGASLIYLEAAEALAAAPTARCAAILLDQFNGALEAAFAALAPQLAQQLLSWAGLGLHLVQPWRVLLYGQVNAGKSSLLNALAGYERAIVSPIPGATRDVLHASVALDGWPVELIDGAGFREEGDLLESAGRAMLAERMAEADLRVLVVDTSVPPSENDRHLAERFGADLTIGAKLDLATDWPAEQLASLDLRCSAVTGKGIDALAILLANRLVPRVPSPGEAVPFTKRQVQQLEQFLSSQG